SSELKKGTSFSFDLTFPLTDMPVHPTLKMHTDTQHNKIENLKILLAEDNDMNILFMKKLLSNWNISLTVVENGQEAVKAVSEQEFDVILMDIHMPVMDGYVATQKIRSMSDPSKANIYIIALTASSAAEMEKIKERGMDDYLTKPFSIDILKQKLSSIPLSEKQGIIE
ncbi:response regulator, partial [Pseudoxanthomonas sp. SGD-10]